MTFNAPEGVFGNPDALSLHLGGLRSAGMRPDVPGRTDHDLRELRRRPRPAARHRADLQHRPGHDQTALFAFIVPTLDIPIQIPVAVRTGSDFGLRFTVADLTQTRRSPRRPDLLGLSPSSPTTAQRFPKDRPGTPRLRAQLDTGCISGSAVEPARRASDRQPDGLHQQSLSRTWRCGPTRTPRIHLRASALPSDHRLLKEVFKPVLFAEPDDERDRFCLRTRPQPQNAAVPRVLAVALAARARRSSRCRRD